MFTAFLYVLLTIWSRLKTSSGVACRAIQNCVSGRIFSLRKSKSITRMISLPRPDKFRQTPNFKVSTGKINFSTHSGFCENSPFDRWQAFFRLTLLLPLFGKQWSLNRPCFGAGTV